MVAFRAHLVGDDALWVGTNWFMPFAVTSAVDGSAYDLTTYSVGLAAVRAFPGASGSLFAPVVTIDTPKTNGTGLIAVTPAMTAAIKAGRYAYELILQSSGPAAAVPDIVFYGDLEVRVH